MKNIRRLFAGELIDEPVYRLIYESVYELNDLLIYPPIMRTINKAICKAASL
ncbi:hypothetical protein [Parabacteroides bouchesdurhonensis]|uniref:hypothetical protein n=1 Tax=Parabacteroides bouchesdurhonensis TaxID=1936995 RepID=UPI00164E8BA0|nr:hypothetical protein [Parabacteroides bouchesdurhonensis]